MARRRVTPREVPSEAKKASLVNCIHQHLSLPVKKHQVLTHIDNEGIGNQVEKSITGAGGALSAVELEEWMVHGYCSSSNSSTDPDLLSA